MSGVHYFFSYNVNYCEMYFNIIVSSIESLVAVLGHLPYYDIILLVNSSETSRIVKVVSFIQQAHCILSTSIVHTTRHSPHHANYMSTSSLELRYMYMFFFITLLLNSVKQEQIFHCVNTLLSNR